jgi:hypothetical protein
MDLRPAKPTNFEAILALNLESVQFLSPIHSAKLEQLASYSVSKSFVSRREAAGSAPARQGEATTTRMI